jgi:hypothetical protein
MCTVAKAEKFVTKWTQRIFDVEFKFKYSISANNVPDRIILFGLSRI